MQKTAWIWFVGFAAWVVDGVVSLRLHSPKHAAVAFFVAALFFTAGLVYQNRRNE